MDQGRPNHRIKAVFSDFSGVEIRLRRTFSSDIEYLSQFCEMISFLKLSNVHVD